ncbi:hypothetical protein P4O66_017386 [Electrophorus voltai]|uniref:Transposase Tc1-like domain-containing protein n=1 Tax=Electrophorus voltai TaxID=2609070 RepID=A0AAD9DNM4_9TELE|nr:hypothetical protein P4O66_017386 [Electrophorus voltai]
MRHGAWRAATSPPKPPASDYLRAAQVPRLWVACPGRGMGVSQTARCSVRLTKRGRVHSSVCEIEYRLIFLAGLASRLRAHISTRSGSDSGEMFAQIWRHDAPAAVVWEGDRDQQEQKRAWHPPRAGKDKRPVMSNSVKKDSGHPRKSSKRQDRLLKRMQLQDQVTTSAELAQEWQKAGVSASAHAVRRRLLVDSLVSRGAEKKPLLSKKTIKDTPTFCRKYRDWTAEDWGKVIFSDEAPFSLGHLDKYLPREEKVSTAMSPVSCQQYWTKFTNLADTVGTESLVAKLEWPNKEMIHFSLPLSPSLSLPPPPLPSSLADPPPPTHTHPAPPKQVKREYEWLRQALCAVTVERDCPLWKRTQLQGKLENLEQVLQGVFLSLSPSFSRFFSPPSIPPSLKHMRDAAERRQQLELEHEQALAVLSAKQQEIDLLQKVRGHRSHPAPVSRVSERGGLAAGGTPASMPAILPALLGEVEVTAPTPVGQLGLPTPRPQRKTEHTLIYNTFFCLQAQVEAKKEHEGAVHLLEAKVRELEERCRTQSEQFNMLSKELEKFRLQTSKFDLLGSSHLTGGDSPSSPTKTPSLTQLLNGLATPAAKGEFRTQLVYLVTRLTRSLYMHQYTRSRSLCT